MSEKPTPEIKHYVFAVLFLAGAGYGLYAVAQNNPQVQALHRERESARIWSELRVPSTPMADSTVLTHGRCQDSVRAEISRQTGTSEIFARGEALRECDRRYGITR